MKTRCGLPVFRQADTCRLPSRIRDERDAFLLLDERGIIEPDLADRLLQTKGFRNILVLEYVELNPKLRYVHVRDDVGKL